MGETSFKSITMQRTACYGYCPVFSLVIFSDGHVLFNGEHFVEKKGKHSWTIGKDAITAMNDAISKHGYFTMIEKTEAKEMTCMPTCITSILMEDGTFREINHDFGLNKFAKKLDAFENKIEKIVGADKYIGKAQFPEELSE